MGINYLWIENSPLMNAMLAAPGWNFKKMMEKFEKEFFVPKFLQAIFEYLFSKIFRKTNYEDWKLSF